MSLKRAVALDCEMVIGKNGQFLPAQVAIVNEYGRALINTFIRQTEVKDYLTWITGITEDDLKNGRDYAYVQQDIAWILQDHLLVGHDLSKDLTCLGLSHPECDKRDTAVYFKNNRGFRKLKDLALEHLDWEIQLGTHDALEDAKASMMLYKKFQDEWEMLITVSSRWNSNSSFSNESRGVSRYDFSRDQWGRSKIHYTDRQVGSFSWVRNLVDFCVTVFFAVFFIFFVLVILVLIFGEKPQK